jgi:Protein of unknown function (DUF3016)
MASSSFVFKSSGALALGALAFGTLAFSALFMAPALAAGSIEVKFEQPLRFSDVGHNAFDRERTLKSLADYLQSLAPQLPNGQTLRIEVLDVDLAGELEPNWRHSGQEVRVLRGRADVPHIRLRYSLQADGQTMKSGEANLVDLNYFFGTPPRESQYGDLPFEKRMLQQWFVNNLNNASAR